MQGCKLNEDKDDHDYYEVKKGFGRKQNNNKMDMRCIHRVHAMEGEYTNKICQSLRESNTGSFASLALISRHGTR